MNEAATALSESGTTLHLLFFIGLLFLVSQAGGRLAGFVRLPRVTGYLIVGVLFGPEVLGVFSSALVKTDLALVTQIALAVIAFSIGGSLKVSRVRRLGGTILWMSFMEVFGAFAAVFLGMTLVLPFFPEAVTGVEGFRGNVAPALVLAAVSTATAPAAVMALIHECRSKGPVTTVLLGLVALDDAICIFFFAIGLNLAQLLVAGNPLTLQTLVVEPVLSLAGALAVGGVAGLVLMYPIRLFHDDDAVLGIMLGAVFVVAGLGLTLGVSHLLAAMMLGFVAVNLFEQHEETFLPVESIEEPLFGLFFTLAGAHLDFSVGGWAVGLAVALTLARFAGKFLGARTGARLGHAPEPVRRYVGLGLLPTAGVAIGLVLEARARLPENPIWGLVVNGVLAAVVINELIAPVFVRSALTRSGEAQRQTRKFSRKEATADEGRS